MLWIRYAAIALAACLWVAGYGQAAIVPNGPQPNVILIMTDDQGYGDVACLGNPHLETPNLDRLYTQSTRLTDYHVDPTCSPTRSALMTGRYSSRTGVWHTIMGRSILHRDEVTLADLFARSGYRTGIFGKWHLGDSYPYRVQDRGFQTSLVHGGGGVGQTPDFWGNDYFDDVYWRNGVPEPQEGYCTDVFFDGAIDFVRASHRAGKPFFCYLPTNAAHGPFRVADEYAAPYRELGLKEPLASFYGMITNIDDNLARLDDTLEKLGIRDDTILVFTTDNGSARGAYPADMRGRKGSPYDGGHRVPCFVRWPGHFPAGRDVDELTAHVDWLPTLAQLCGLTLPEGVTLDGRSLVPLLQGDVANWPERTLFVHSQRIEHPEKWRQSSVMTERWRLVGKDELYDIEADPTQKRNVAAEHPGVVDELRRAYLEWWDSISTRFDGHVRLVLGAPEENPTHLTCHDWHGEHPGGADVPWNQGMIESEKVGNGYWTVDVARAGTYRFTLRRQPAVDPAPLLGETAALRVGEVAATKRVPEGATAIDFEVELPAGPTRLQTCLTTAEGVTRGAYFVDVEWLGDE